MGLISPKVERFFILLMKTLHSGDLNRLANDDTLWSLATEIRLSSRLLRDTDSEGFPNHERNKQRKVKSGSLFQKSMKFFGLSTPSTSSQPDYVLELVKFASHLLDIAKSSSTSPSGIVYFLTKFFGDADPSQFSVMIEVLQLEIVQLSLRSGTYGIVIS